MGWAHSPPWVVAAASEPSGLEPDIIRQWARALQARIEWVHAGEAGLVTALQGHAIDIAVGGFTTSAPWGAKIGQTQPYLTSELVVGLAPGAPQPAAWDNLEIRYARSRPDIAGLIRKHGATPVPSAPDQLTPVGAAYSHELTRLGLVPTGTNLAREKRVILTAPVENALTLALDRFLNAHRAEVARRLAGDALP